MLSRRGHPAFRVGLADGRQVKARVFETRGQAARVDALLRSAGVAELPAPLLRVGRALAVEFVTGEALDSLLPAAPGVEARWVRGTGRLLARLHARSRPRAEAALPAFYTTGLARGVGRLLRAGLLDRPAAQRLLGLRPPALGRPVLTHGDLCPENLILTPSGRLRAIDEERLAVRPAAFDIARTVIRWRLLPALEAELQRGYAEAGGAARAFRIGRRFWHAVALLVSAEHRLRHDPGGLAAPLSGLRALLATLR